MYSAPCNSCCLHLPCLPCPSNRGKELEAKPVDVELTTSQPTPEPPPTVNDPPKPLKGILKKPKSVFPYDHDDSDTAFEASIEPQNQAANDNYSAKQHGDKSKRASAPATLDSVKLPPKVALASQQRHSYYGPSPRLPPLRPLLALPSRQHASPFGQQSADTRNGSTETSQSD